MAVFLGREPVSEQLAQPGFLNCCRQAARDRFLTSESRVAETGPKESPGAAIPEFCVAQVPDTLNSVLKLVLHVLVHRFEVDAVALHFLVQRGPVDPECFGCVLAVPAVGFQCLDDQLSFRLRQRRLQ